MAKIDNILAQMKRNPKNVGFSDLCKVCENFRIYKTPWQGDSRINIQNDKGKAKAYHVKQVLLALERLEVSRGIKK